MARDHDVRPSLRRPCVECGRPTRAWHAILELHVCRGCQAEHERYRLITKTRAAADFRLSAADLDTLDFIETRNPHYNTAAPMQLFLRSQIEKLAKQKWGSDEPYLVTLTSFSAQQLAWLLEDPDRLRSLSPDRFELLIADRLEHLGLSVQGIGSTYAKDGGVDLIAYPKTQSVPFLLAVQVKHHRTKRKTPATHVRDFHGVLANSPFHMGMLVTNTTFTPDALWFANNNRRLLRLRDLADLQRWLKEDFVNECEWREIPDQIEIAHGVTVVVEKQSIWLPTKDAI